MAVSTTTSDPLVWPRSANQLRTRLQQLSHRRTQLVDELRKARGGHEAAAPADRKKILATTNGQYHICGGRIHGEHWVADHVFARAVGGSNSPDNFQRIGHVMDTGGTTRLKELRLVLRMAIWARHRMVKSEENSFGDEMLRDFWAWEKASHH
jgi:hypothetical protein